MSKIVKKPKRKRDYGHFVVLGEYKQLGKELNKMNFFQKVGYKIRRLFRRRG